MAGLTGEIHVVRYGSGDNNQPTSYGVGANQQLYYGEVALLSGSGSVTTGYLKNAATPGSADLVAGMIGDPAGGTQVKTGPGILGGSTDGGVWCDVLTGAFFFLSGGTAGDALSAATNGKTVYYGGETANGPYACATSAGGTRPVLGVQLAQDPGIAGGFSPGASYWPVKLNVIGGP
jgi:hypothetical protein